MNASATTAATRPGSRGKHRMTPIRIAAAALGIAALAVLAGTAPARASSETTQTFQLQPGWNAIWLEVQPEIDDTASVFQGIPLRSVWRWASPSTPVQAVPDPADGLRRGGGWLHYFPNTPEALTNDLLAIQVNQAYLVEVGGSQPVTLQVTGRPSLGPIFWVPDSYNLVGMGVEPVSEPTFAAFFEASLAHDGQPIYRLQPDGVWRLAAAGEKMRAGEAFWIYTDGGSGYDGPVAITIPSGDGLVFSVLEVDQRLTLGNLAAGLRGIEVRPLGGAAGELRYETRNPANGEVDATWIALGAGVTRGVAAGEESILRLGVDQGQVSGIACSFESRTPGADCTSDADCPDGRCVAGIGRVLEVADGAGARRLLPLLIEKPGPATATEAAGCDLTGLWVGTITVDQVARVHCDSPDGNDQCLTVSPTGTDGGNTFSQRILLHKAGDGVRMLEQAIQMRDAENRPVLVTRDADIPRFQGAVLRDGVAVGQRVSTVAFRWDDNAAGVSNGGMLGSGDLGLAGTLSFTIPIPAESTSNPYYHRYHPDHGTVELAGVCDGGEFACQACDSDADCGPGGSCSLSLEISCPGRDLPTITRTVTLAWAAADPSPDSGGNPRPDWGCTRLGGTYQEDIDGLHFRTLRAEGTFEIEMLSPIGALNPVTP